jgi:hypothetical protein
MTTVSIKMNNQEKALLEVYAKANGLSLSQAAKKLLFERLEDEANARIADLAHAEFLQDLKTVSGQELKEKYPL